MEEKLKFNQTPHLSIEDLKAHIPQKDYFIGIDSDGTVFDSMELKHKDCFIGSLIRVFQIASIAHEVHQVWNYVNIFSKTRGTNRFKALILTFKHLNTMNRVKELGIELPNLNSLKHWSDSSSSLGNDSLSEYIASDISVEKKDLKVVLEWSNEVNRSVKETVFNLPPIPGALEAMDYLQAHADLFVISNTPLDTLHREWKDNNIISKVRMIGGQETGTKTEMLKSVAMGKYDKNKILIIGDSPGDLTAAQNIGALFYPIIPSEEYESWDNFNKQYRHKFLTGNYKKSGLEKDQITAFKSTLEKTPSWVV